MDKNTMQGLLLMGGIILLFMWLQAPSKADLERQRQQAEAELAALNADDPAVNDVLTVDSISADELATIEATIRRYGTLDTITHVTSLRCGGADLTLSADGTPGGTINTGTALVPVSDILNRNYTGLAAGEPARAVAALKKALDDVARYQGFARYLSGDSTTVTLANRYLTLNLSNKGGIIASASLNDYRKYDSTLVTPIAPGLDGMSFTLTSATRRFDTREFYFTPVQENDSTVLMNMDLGDGATFGIRYTLHPDSYLVRMQVVQNGMDAVIPSNVSSIDFDWHSAMLRNEAGRMFEERNSRLYYMFANGDVEDLSESKTQTKEVNERLRWIGFKNQFFSTVLVSHTDFQSAELTSEVVEKSALMLKRMSARTTLDYSCNHAMPVDFTIFIGPNSYPLLNDLQHTIVPESDMHLTKLIPLGWALFRWINTWIVIPVFNLLGSHIASYGIIILLLTIFIKLLLFPFTYKSYRSQATMRLLAPEINAINEKYPGNENAMKRQQETMAIYSRAGASPFSGCLPMLLQMPILIAMFNFFPSAIELRGQSFLWAKDLSAPDAIVSWTTNIYLISSTFGNHISLFCLLMTAVNIIYTRVTMQSQPSGNSMPGMKWMMYLMPLMFLVFFNNYASGLSYYYFLSLLITIMQTYIFRLVIDEDKLRAKMAENARKPRKKSGFMARLEEAQRQQQAMLREQQKRQKGNKR